MENPNQILDSEELETDMSTGIHTDVSLSNTASSNMSWYKAAMKSRDNKRLGDVYELDDITDYNGIVRNDSFAFLVQDFHDRTEGTTQMPISTSRFVVAMSMLEDYPEIRSELLDRSFSKSFIGGWRPVGEEERALLDSWLEQIDDASLYVKVIFAGVKSGTRYLNREDSPQ